MRSSPPWQAAQLPLDSLPLASEPFIDLMSLGWYETQTHSAYWDSWCSTQWGTNQLPDVGVQGLPFVVSADGERITLGAFMTSMSSVSVDMPVIVIEDMQDPFFQIAWGYPGGPPPSPDPREDPRILNALASSSKLVP